MSKFDVKDRLDNLMYSTYNCLAELFFHLDIKSKHLVQRNIAFRNIHDGERCFILGTGPSLNTLTENHVDKLKSEVVFGVNSLYKSEIGAALKPSYYMLLDSFYWEIEKWNNVYLEVANQYANDPPIFITGTGAQRFVDNLGLPKRSIYLYFKKYPTKEMSVDITQNLYATMNCVSTSILVAIYMGFKKVYLLGCDYNAFCNAGAGHCYDDKDELKDNPYNLAFYLKFYWITTEFHYLVAKLAIKLGVEVVNLTPGSLLDAYPKIPVGEVI